MSDEIKVLASIDIVLVILWVNFSLAYIVTGNENKKQMLINCLINPIKTSFPLAMTYAFIVIISAIIAGILIYNHL